VTVLLLTRSDDHYVPDIVAAAVQKQGGGDVVRVNTDDYPDAISSGDDGRDPFLRVDGRTFFRSALRGVWCRRVWAGSRVHCDPDFRPWALAQAVTAFGSVVRAMGPIVVNDPDAEDRAEDKALQLRLARDLGFRVPQTLISNDVDAVSAFVDDAASAGRQVITKLLRPLSQTMGGDGPFMFSRTLRPEDLRHLAEVRVAPQIFQHRINKRLDIRVQVMGDVVVAGATACVGDDWRRDSDGRFVAWPISESLAQRCRALCRQLGLMTGAIDLVVDDDTDDDTDDDADGDADGDAGVHFLEINPSGEWGMLERDLQAGLPDALAHLLLGAPRG
jgi:glutathione synthase/RimK-type ligase-like ATP-grasp enzyme